MGNPGLIPRKMHGAALAHPRPAAAQKCGHVEMTIFAIRERPDRGARRAQAGLNPRCMATIPIVRLRQATRSQPAPWIFPARVGWSGQSLIDSARYS